MTRVTDKISKTEEAKKNRYFILHTLYTTPVQRPDISVVLFLWENRKRKAKDRIITKVVCLPSRLGCN